MSKKIEKSIQKTENISLSHAALEYLQYLARVQSVYYSTKMSGSRLTMMEVAQVLASKQNYGRHYLTDSDFRMEVVIAEFGRDGIITVKEIEKLLKIGLRTARDLCKQWLNDDFIEILNPAKRNRSYVLKNI